jgi:hypothetical protein
MSAAGLADLPVIDATNHALIGLFVRDSDGRVTKLEIVKVTAHTASSTSATIVRAQQGTTDQSWSIGDKWGHGLTAEAMTTPKANTSLGAYSGLLMGDWADGTQAGFTAFPPTPGDLNNLQCNFRGDSGGNSVFNARAAASVYVRVADQDRMVANPSDIVFSNVPVKFNKEKWLVNLGSRPALNAGAALEYAENGQLHVRNSDGLIVPVSEIKRLESDMAASTDATNFTDLTGLSFPIAAGEQVEYEARILYSTAATTTGIVLTVTGPALNMAVADVWTFTTATAVVRATNAGSGGAMVTTGVVAANTNQWAYVTGMYDAASAGTVQLRFRSEVASSGVTPKRGSFLSVLSRG